MDDSEGVRRSNQPQPANDGPNVLAERLSTSIPRLLTGLAHEPSLGLHVVANHARTAAVPTLVGIRRNVDKRSALFSDSTMDSTYAVDALQQHREVALPALASVEANLKNALEKLQDPP